MRPEEETQPLYIGKYTDWYRNGMNVLHPCPHLKAEYNIKWKWKYLVKLKVHKSITANLAIL
jgi:hypothetical protein